MGKKGKQAKKRKLLSSIPTSPLPEVKGSDVDGPSLTALVSEDEIAIATETLEILSKNPSCLRSKSLKKIKAAVYDFQRVSQSNSNTGERQYF